MSRWFIPEGLDFTPPRAGPITTVSCGTSDIDTPTVVTADALSTPALDDLRDSHLMLLPMGAAWRTPDGQGFNDPDTSVMGRLVKAMSAPFLDLYRAAFELTNESTAWTLDLSLADWEADYGLPDPCISAPEGREARIRALRLKIRANATITPADYVCLARSIGYDVVIEEPMPFRFGQSSFGNGDRFSGQTPGEVDMTFDWYVWVVGFGVDWFTFGKSRFGVGRFGHPFTATDLECAFGRIAPADTKPHFVYP
ncbi:putative phage tail protein [Ahrensia sp. R2A130]|uniref:putative phage tail protein n=1 Tax=Ahrensia sp. R2A130 TaxID=744979 RepID=UPI0001E0B500|nr:putative phage tail protein [Ahrensia sp. R2A130]EFL88270.1 putative bacteriophage related protein [Ahrensia sp. R2A130]